MSAEQISNPAGRNPLCPVCRQEMRLVGIEWDTEVLDLYTFQCDGCGRLEVRNVRTEK